MLELLELKLQPLHGYNKLKGMNINWLIKWNKNLKSQNPTQSKNISKLT